MSFHLQKNNGSEEEPNYRFKYEYWETEASSLVGSEDGWGFSQNIWVKDGRYACPSQSSYDVPFARECGWEFVVSFPSHHDVVSGPEFLGNEQWREESGKWYDALPFPDDCLDDNDLLGLATLARLSGG